MNKEKLHIILPAIVAVLVYLIWIDWDYRSILPPSNEPQPLLTIGGPPQIWSGHKLIPKNTQQCAAQGKSILKNLNFIKVQVSGSYVYGNFGSIRAAFKCIDLGPQTFVYVIVAGSDINLVEQLRNNIVHAIK